MPISIRFGRDIRFGFGLRVGAIFRQRGIRGRPRLAQPFPGTPPTFPQPAPRPQRGPTTVPFPRTPAANDPIFGILGRIIRRGLGSIGIVLGGIDLLEQIQVRGMDQILEDILNRTNEARRTRRQIERPPREIEFPEPLTDPPEIPAPAAPPRPEIPPQIPRPPSPVFEPPPVRVPTPRVPTPTFPRPSPIPAPRPLPSPRQFPQPGIRVLPLGLPLPGPGTFSPRSPQLRPRQRPDIDPRTLTPISPGVPPLTTGVTFPFPQPTPTPQAQPRRRCQEVKRRRRRKNKCREGFFKETPTKTTYITWRTINCVTRKPTVNLRSIT